VNAIEFQPMGTQVTIRLTEMTIEIECISKLEDFSKILHTNFNQYGVNAIYDLNLRFGGILGLCHYRGNVCGIMLVYQGIYLLFIG